MSRSEIHTLTFDSLVDAARFARDNQRITKKTRYSDTPRVNDSSEDEQNNHAWDGGFSLDKTLDFLTSGGIWDEGVAKMTDAMEITDDLAARSDLPRINNVIQGGAVSIGRYVTGDPRCMRRRNKQPAVDKPVLAIGIQLGIYHGISAEQKINFGAAMLSAVDELERNGYRCEVVALWRQSDTNGDDYSRYVNIEYNLKGAVDRWNPAALAFAMAHPAFQRRLTWRIAETQPQYWDALIHGYCTNVNTRALTRSMAADFDIYFASMENNVGKKCSTPEGAFEYVNEVVKKQLAVAKEAATQ